MTRLEAWIQGLWLVSLVNEAGTIKRALEFIGSYLSDFAVFRDGAKCFRPLSPRSLPGSSRHPFGRILRGVRLPRKASLSFMLNITGISSLIELESRHVRAGCQIGLARHNNHRQWVGSIGYAAALWPPSYAQIQGIMRPP